MRIGITGINGLIGSYFISWLLKNRPDLELILFCRENEIPKAVSSTVSSTTPSSTPTATSSYASNSTNSNIQIFKGSLNDSKSCFDFINHIDVLFHFASVNTGPMRSLTDWSTDLQLNAVPILNLLTAASKIDRKIQFIFPSSGGTVYKDNNNKIPFKESDPLLPQSSYANHKLLIENYLRLAAIQYPHIFSVNLRISNPYGVLLDTQRGQGLIGIVFKQILMGETVNLFGSPENVRDFIYLEDLCFAFNALIEKPIKNITLNIGSGKGYSVMDIIKCIEITLNKRAQIHRTNDLQSSLLPSWVTLDIELAKQTLSWAPSTDLKTGLHKMLTSF